MSVHICGETDGLRVFILAGQHGDEPEAREAAAQYLANLKSHPALPLTIAVLVDANPDGAWAQTRRSASATDLNRDHLLLSQPETKAIHGFVCRWKPDLVIDLHTYRPWREELSQHGLVFPQHLMLDFPTNPAARSRFSTKLEKSLLAFVRARITDAGYRCDRYTLVRSSGIVRHSNLDIVDARNGIAVRYGILTVLLEGRRSSLDDPSNFPSPAVVLLQAIEAVIEWARENGTLVRHLQAMAHKLQLVPVRCQYTTSKTTVRRMEMLSAATGDIQQVAVPGEYLSFVKVTKMIQIPRAYAVFRDALPLLELLARQRFESVPAQAFRDRLVEMYRILSCTLTPENGELLPLPQVAVERSMLDPEEFVVFPTDQVGGSSLALLLEPQSQFGAHRLTELQLHLQPGMLYPAARLM